MEDEGLEKDQEVEVMRQALLHLQEENQQEKMHFQQQLSDNQKVIRLKEQESTKYHEQLQKLREDQTKAMNTFSEKNQT